ncbi:uncharacterized protein LOC128216575 isoform X2 [Mya arenaria]|uniref:uncharacterized protein LOC128216575 isoform X2 n=1 Tax=Mya arenaria TaxID=6604 RepID=UPI0022E706E7|nr:uncharacterized protein LOC128216575 isoform X2 [Mya arenaria]
MQTCAIQCSEYNYFAFQEFTRVAYNLPDKTRTKCYCLDDRHGFLTLEGYCSYPCPGSLGQMCGGPNTITVYNSDAGTTCPLLRHHDDGFFTSNNADCSKKRRYICQKELCGQNFIDNQGSFTFTGHGETDCNWTISVGSHVSVNVDADMGTSRSSCQYHNLSIFTPTTSIADLRQSLCKDGNILFSGLGPVFIHLTADSLRPTTMNVRWETNTTSDSTITTKKGDVITSISTIHNDETEGVSKSTIHIDKTEGVSKSTIHIDKTEGVSKSTIHNDETEDASKSTIHIDKTEGAGDDQQDGNKVALYVPVTVTMCVIVAVAIFIAICLRRKRKQKKAKGKVDEHSYSNTTTEHQAINSLQSHTERELGEYTALYKPQGSVANAKSQDYAVLHQQLEPAHSPDDTEYTEVNPYVNG